MSSRILPNAALVDKTLIDRGRNLSPALLCDALGNFGAMDYRIKPVWTGAMVIGTALTVKLRPGDNLLLHRAICQAAPGYVIVAETGGCTTNAVWGDMMTRAALKAGSEGTVIDGVVRDVEDIKDFRYPVFAIGAIPQAAHRDGPGSINVPISCGGVSVEPGDFIFGNADGVVVVPRALYEDALRIAERKLAGENDRFREIEAGKIAPQWLAGKMKAIGLE
jgi:RraA family protein